MSTEIQLVYIATNALVLPSRLNTEQTLSITANQNDPPMPQIDGKTQLSRRGLRAATTIHGRWYRGTINTPYVSGAERQFWREYLESTAEQETHRLVHPAFLGWDSDVNDLSIYRPMNTGSFSRWDLGDDYKASIQWRQVAP